MATRTWTRKAVAAELLLLGPLVLFASTSACRTGIGDSGPVVVAVVEVTDAAAPVTTGAMTPAAGDGEHAAGMCTFEVEVDDIEPSSRTCTIYEEVSKGGGTVTMPCGGADGPASASFGEHEYRGEVKSSRLTLQHSFDFDEKDGCRWRVVGRISGTAGAAKIAWTYAERILEDDTSNCWATCTARTSMRLTPVR